MRAVLFFGVLVAGSCGGQLPVVVQPTPNTTPNPSVLPTLTLPPTETPWPGPSTTPRPSPTASPTPFRTPRPSDPELLAMASTTLDGIKLPRVFPYKVQLYEPLGNYHAGFGGFSGGVAVLLIGRDDVKSNTVTHEYGHAWHEYFMKNDKSLWAQYGAIRGFTDPIQLVQGANYLDDWRERFANDFQWAFNPDYGDRYAPGPGYWDPLTYQKFKDFVKGLATSHS